MILFTELIMGHCILHTIQYNCILNPIILNTISENKSKVMKHSLTRSYVKILPIPSFCYCYYSFSHRVEYLEIINDNVNYILNFKSFLPTPQLLCMFTEFSTCGYTELYFNQIIYNFTSVALLPVNLTVKCF